MKYKVGDKVRVNSIDWYNKNKDEYDYIDFGKHMFYPLMSKYCGKVFTIDYVYSDFYTMNNNDYEWTDEMIEGLVEEETSQNAKLVSERFSEYVNPSEFKYAQDTITKMPLQGANIPNEYILKDENNNVINTTKIVLEKKKKEYPKTYKECCKILDIDSGCLLASYDIGLWKDELLSSLQKLLICRDAYWKIAGEEMGLDDPWEPDYTNTCEKKFSIWVDFGEIKLGTFTTTQMVLSFPTEEMRDGFKENFGPDIEICKEFL